jgi:hypothetical protein
MVVCLGFLVASVAAVCEFMTEAFGASAHANVGRVCGFAGTWCWPLTCCVLWQPCGVRYARWELVHALPRLLSLRAPTTGQLLTATCDVVRGCQWLLCGPATHLRRCGCCCGRCLLSFVNSACCCADCVVFWVTSLDTSPRCMQLHVTHVCMYGCMRVQSPCTLTACIS